MLYDLEWNQHSPRKERQEVVTSINGKKRDCTVIYYRIERNELPGITRVAVIDFLDCRLIQLKLVADINNNFFVEALCDRKVGAFVVVNGQTLWSGWS
jgi:hypothetical protein